MADTSHSHVPERLSFYRHPWFLVLVSGLVLWVICAAVTAVTRDNILVPSVILIGSFVAPVAVVTFALGRLEGGHLSAPTIFAAFILSGTLGVVASALLETYLLPSATGTFIMVGLIEELCKAAIVVVVGTAVVHRTGRDGLVLGAIVGAGFAAFESSGYAFATLLKHVGDHPIGDVMSTEMTRAVFSPFAHITWTALFGGALFASVRNGRFHLLSRTVLLTLLGTITLHAVWDQSTGWAIMVTKGIVESTWVLEWPNTEHWVGLPTDQMLLVWSIVYDGLLIINSAIGVSWIINRWRRYPSPLPLAIPD